MVVVVNVITMINIAIITMVTADIMGMNVDTMTVNMVNIIIAIIRETIIMMMIIIMIMGMNFMRNGVSTAVIAENIVEIVMVDMSMDIVDIVMVIMSMWIVIMMITAMITAMTITTVAVLVALEIVVVMDMGAMGG